MQYQHYQLSYFEKLIRVDLKNVSATQKEPDSKFFAFTTTDVINQKESMLQSFGRYLYDLGKKKQVGWYISMHQQQLVLLLDQMATYLPEVDVIDSEISLTDITWLNLYKIIYLSLSELLSFLECQFARYLDIDCKVPSSYLLRAKNKFFKDVERLREDFGETATEKRLISIIFQPFTDFIESDRTGLLISYQQLYFLKEMGDKLSELLKDVGDGVDLTEKVKDLLLYLNFNSMEYFHYWTETINAEIDNLPTTQEKLDRLIFLQKKASQAISKPGFIFKRLYAPLQSQLLSWLADEITYQKERAALAHGGHTSDELSRWKDFKVLTSFSVPQLGNIIRLLVDNGLYLNKNKTEVLDFFSHFFTSVKQDTISAGSLRSNFYKDDAAVSKAVRNILTDLIKSSHK